MLGGYLGAGKTTLVNHLLRNAGGRRIAVMVNDFGEIGIDADLIVGQSGEIMQLAGGCICCSVGSDLMGALIALGERNPRPDLILIETSGVALPGSVARSARLAPGIAIDAVVVLADAKTVQTQATDRYVGDTVLAQLREADLLVLNKMDEIAAEALLPLHDWIASVTPRTRIIHAIEADIPPELVLGLAGASLQHQARSRAGGRVFAGDSTIRSRGLTVGAAASRFDSGSFRIPQALDVQMLIERLCDSAMGLIRIKGLLTDVRKGPVVVQAVGPRARIEPAPAYPDPGVPLDGRLVVIGLRGVFNRESVESLIAECMGSTEE